MPLGDRTEITEQLIRGQRPDLDLTGWRLLARIGRLWYLATEAIADALRPFGLTQHEYIVLASLRDAGPPYTSSPSRLLDAALITTSGGLTNMLHRLEANGLIARMPDPSDRRGVLVTLTDGGLALIQDATTAYINAENQLIAGLSPAQAETLTLALRDFLVTIEPVSIP